MDNFESTILRWICLFDEFKNIEYTNTKHLITSTSFKQFVDNVFCLKHSSALSTDNTQIYNTIKVTDCEFDELTLEDFYNDEDSIYACVVVLLHALLKCTNDKFRNQLCERMDNEDRVLLFNYIKATQPLLFTKQNISETIKLSEKHTSLNLSEICSDNSTSIKSKSMCRSYLQKLCQSPKSQSLINQEKEKLNTKLTEDYKNECEENYKLAENVKHLKDLATKLSNKLEDEDKILQKLKDEIKEYSKPNRDKIDLEMNCNELKYQFTELEKKHEELNRKFELKTSDYNNLILMFDNIENENMLLKTNLKLFEETIQKKDTEITSLKNQLCNKSITNISSQEDETTRCYQDNTKRNVPAGIDQTNHRQKGRVGTLVQFFNGGGTLANLTKN